MLFVDATEKQVNHDVNVPVQGSMYQCCVPVLHAPGFRVIGSLTHSTVTLYSETATKYALKYDMQSVSQHMSLSASLITGDTEHHRDRSQQWTLCGP